MPLRFWSRVRIAAPPPAPQPDRGGPSPSVGGSGSSEVSQTNSTEQPLATDPSRTSFREWPDPGSKLYWLDVDVAFKDIIRQQRMAPFNRTVRAPRSSLRHSVLHGVGTAANALSVGDRANIFDHFAVDVAAFVQTEEDFELYHRSAKMIWNEIDIHSPRLQVHVQPGILRHLVELYLTKRIDTVRISMKIAIERQIIEDTGPNSELLPALDSDGRLYFRRTECELLAVQASLARERITR